MNRNFKRILAALTAVLTLLPLTACGETAPDAAATKAQDDAAGAEVTTVIETEPPEYTDPGLDYEGAYFPAAVYQWESNTWKLGYYCEMYAEAENGDPINDAVYTRNREVEELLNVKFGVVPILKMSSTDEITKPILAGENNFYFISANGTGMVNVLNNNGMLIDLAGIDTLDLSASWWDQASVAEFQIAGFQYAVTGDYNFYNKGAPITNFFSKKLVDDLNLDDPYQKVRDGKWTLDVMLDYARTAARDLNGDGVMTAEEDCWGLEGEHSTVREFVYGCGQRISDRDSDGNIVITINTQQTATVVEKFVPFMRDKNVCIYAQDYGSKYASAYFDLMLPRFTADCAMFYSNQLLVALDLRDMNSDFGILPLPKFDESQTDYCGSTSYSWHTFTQVPVTNNDLDMTGEVLNALGYYSQQLITPAFIEQTVLTKTMRDDDSAEMMQLIFDSMTYDVAILFDWGGVKSLFGTLTSNNDTGFASAYAKIESKVEAGLAKTMESLNG